MVPPTSPDPPATLSQTTLTLVLQLVRREEYRFGPAMVRSDLERGAIGTDVSPDEAPLIAAGAAIAGGEPKRALRELAAHRFGPGSAGLAVAEALRRVALTLDRNWFPGGAGAVLEDGDLVTILDTPVPDPGPAAALLVEVATDVAAMTPTWRSIVEGGRGSDPFGATTSVLAHVQAIGAQLVARGDASSLGYLATIHADLAVRAGQFEAASGLLGTALQAYQATSDAAGIGSTLLVRGDWSSEPVSHPETLGLDLEGRVANPAVEISHDLEFARQLYTQATTSFTFAKAERGLAAIELRLAHLDSLEDRRDGARTRIQAVVERATSIGDGSMIELARVHLALSMIEDDLPIDPETIGQGVATWAMSDGSYSFARGLARLCLAAARAWRERGEFVRGRSALRIADAINVGVGAVQEPALVSTEVAESYGGANYRRALLVLTEVDLDAAIEGLGQGGSVVPWLGLVDRTTRGLSAAIALRDSDAIDRSVVRLRRLNELSHGLAIDPAAGEPMFVASAAGAAEDFLAQGQVLSPLYRGTTARTAGLPEEAALQFADALEKARVLEPAGGMLTAVILGTMGNVAEARPMVEALVASGQLPPGMAASLFLRVGDPAAAANEIAKLDATGPPPRPDQPLDEAVIRGEVAAANGAWEVAASATDPAIAAFELRVARLSRDVLRISMSDNLDVVSLYTTAIRSRLAEGDPSGAAAFRVSDRCRGTALADLIAGDAAAGTSPATVTTMRRWLRAGVLLAQAFEDIAYRASDDGAQIRGRIADAERELDDAEAALYRDGGGFLASRTKAPPTPDLSDIQALLRPDTVLLQYHVFDDELFVWAVTADTAEIVRSPARTSILSGDARRFHRLCADGISTAEARAPLGEALAAQVLTPVASRLDGHPRIVVVPHAGLSLLPFHLLPFGGDVLGAGRAVSYLPAVSVAPRWRTHAPVRLDRDALVVGDPHYGPGRNLRQLPSARLEATVVAATLGAEPLIGDAATADTVRMRLPGAHVLHLATHGRAFDGAPNSAELALAGEDRLSIADLMGSDTDIDLAVLSACDTGRGTATASGDVVGLTRALLGAGARDIVVSLWPVNDLTACLTMARFYDQLRAGAGVAEALADAQAEVRRLDSTERETWYASLAHGASGRGMAHPSGSRAWAPGGPGPASSTPDAAHPALWGPFVHIGL